MDLYLGVWGGQMSTHGYWQLINLLFLSLLAGTRKWKINVLWISWIPIWPFAILVFKITKPRRNGWTRNNQQVLKNPCKVKELVILNIFVRWALDLNNLYCYKSGPPRQQIEHKQSFPCFFGEVHYIYAQNESKHRYFQLIKHQQAQRISYNKQI